jgi:hypothetical protein
MLLDVLLVLTKDYQPSSLEIKLNYKKLMIKKLICKNKQPISNLAKLN